MRIREGDPLEIYTTRDGEVIFKKYSLIGGLEDFAAQFCDTLSRSTDFTAAVTDRDAVIAVAGAGKRELLGKPVSDQLEKLMTERSGDPFGGMGAGPAVGRETARVAAGVSGQRQFYRRRGRPRPLRGRCAGCGAVRHRSGPSGR